MTEIEIAKKTAELTKKLESANREAEQYKKFLERDIKNIRDTSRNRIKYESAVESVKHLQKELDRLK